MYRNQQCVADPDPTLHFDADLDPDPDPDPTPSFNTCWKIRTKNLTFIHSSARLRCFVFIINVIGVINFQYFGHYIENFWKKYSLALQFVDMDTDWQAMGADPDPDPPKWCRSDQIRIHKTGNHREGNAFQECTIM
jgi:hypothetical protein